MGMWPDRSHEGQYCVCNLLWLKSVESEKLFIGAITHVLIIHPDEFHGNGTSLRQELGNRAAQPPDEVMLLHGHHFSCLLGSPDEELAVERFDCVNVYKPDIGYRPLPGSSLAPSKVAL